jgi:hypothetical protein
VTGRDVLECIAEILTLLALYGVVILWLFIAFGTGA